MATQPEKLDRDSALMLYAAGEMQPAERELFERRLAAEPDLAAELLHLTEAHRAFVDAFAHADEHTWLPASDAVTTRRVSRAIHQWQVDRIVAAQQSSKKIGKSQSWWLYPTAAAAILLIGSLIIWSNRQELGTMPPSDETEHAMQIAMANSDALTNWLVESVDEGAHAEEKADESHDQLTLDTTDDPTSSFLTPREENNW